MPSCFPNSHYSSIEDSWVSNYRYIVPLVNCLSSPSTSATWAKILYDNSDIRYVNINATSAMPVSARVKTVAENDWVYSSACACSCSSSSGSSSITIGATAISGATNGYLLYNNSGVVGELNSTGSGNVVRATSPTIVGGSHTAITSLGIRDTSAAYDLTIAGTSTTPLTTGRTITLDANNAEQTLKFTDASTVTFPAGTNTLATLGTNTFTGQQIITSSSATALTVGQNGATNPALQVDASTASSATGIKITSAAAAGGVTLEAISSGTNETLTLKSKGSGDANLDAGTTLRLKTGGNTRFTTSGWHFTFTPYGNASSTAARFLYTSPNDSAAALTASTEAMSSHWNFGVTRQHATGALTLQRDFRVTGSTHSFVGASTLTDAAAFSVDGPPIAGTNATITNSHGIYVPTLALTGTITNAYGLNVAAPSGATNNYAASFDGKILTANFPTSSAGLASGTIWSNGGVLTLA